MRPPLYKLYFLMAAILVLTNCTHKKQETAPESGRISLQNLKASGPYFTEDEKGNLVLSWVQAVDTANNYLLAYAVSEDGGNTFSEPNTIPTSKGIYPHDENLSKIIYKKNGDMLAMFGTKNPNPDNKYAGMVYYSQSFDKGRHWTEPRPLSPNAGNSIDERYFDALLLPTGEIAAIWLDSRKETEDEGSSLYFAVTDGRNGFTQEKVIDEHLCQCCRTDLYLDKQGRLHAAYRGILNGTTRDMMHLVSEDDGHTFSKPERISPDNWQIDGCPHTGPTMVSNQNGMHFAWYTQGGGSGIYYNKREEGTAFSERQPVSLEASAKHPQLAAYGQDHLAIVWDEQFREGERFYNKIGLQLRDPKGNFKSSRYITGTSGSAVFPVVVPVAENKLLVAYTLKYNEQSEVWYKRVAVQ